MLVRDEVGCAADLGCTGVGCSGARVLGCWVLGVPPMLVARVLASIFKLLHRKT